MIEVKAQPLRIYIERGDQLQQLNCDFLLQNHGSIFLQLDTIEVSIFDHRDLLVVRRVLDTHAISPSIAILGTTKLAPDSALTIFNPFHTFPSDIPLHHLRYRFALTNEEGESAALVEVSVQPIMYETKADLTLPVRGRLIVWDGHDFYAHHRRVALTHPLIRELGVQALTGRYAYDFDLIDEQGALYRGDGMANEDWFGFGVPILAPADGTVVAIEAALADNDVGAPSFDFATAARHDLRRINGNYVVLDHFTGEYSLLCHLMQNSVIVRPGQYVHQGQPIARMGNSGATTHIHLHYELADGYDMYHSEGVPAYFRRFQRLRGSQAKQVDVGILDTGEIIESTVPLAG